MFIERGWDEIYNTTFYHHADLLKRAIKDNLPDRRLLDDFFMIGRKSINNKKIALPIRSDIFEYIINTGIKIYNES